MRERKNRHLEFYANKKNIPFVIVAGGGGKPKQPPNRPIAYIDEKRKELREIKDTRLENGIPLNKSITITGAKDTDKLGLLFENLDNQMVRLLSIKEDGENILANVQFMNEKLLDKFSDNLFRKGKETKLCLTINNIKESSFRDKITDNSFPDDYNISNKYWFEIWLTNEEKNEIENFDKFISLLKIDFQNVIYNPIKIDLVDRDVVLVKCTSEELDLICNKYPNIAEIRFAKHIKHILDLEMEGQSEIYKDLSKRITIKNDTKTTLVLLDTGVNRGHPLLKDLLAEDRNLTIKTEYGTNDESYVGRHGTGMAGLCLYGDIEEHLNNANKINITHNLSSVKILPINADDETIPVVNTKIAIEIAEASINLNKNYVLATTTDAKMNGIPTLYSSYLDKKVFEIKKLFLVSVGNCCPGLVPTEQHKDKQNTTCIEDPSHSWNVLSIGSYTKKVNFSEISIDGCIPFAEENDISPYSLFSKYQIENNNFPIKPDVVFEGGNLVVTSDNKISNDYHLDLITTHHDFLHKGLFNNFNATSASTALAGRFASILMEEYPNFWAETIKGLIVHSAEWSDKMLEKIKRNKEESLREFGFGVPNLEKAFRSANNSLTLIAQEEFCILNKNNNFNCVYFDLPWPKETLEKLAEKPIKLKITLSYFIEPRGGYRGNKNKFQYQSYGLRFDLKRSTETDKHFFERKNGKERDKDKNYINNNDRLNWEIGERMRDKMAGTVIKDIWNGKSIDLVNMNKIIIYPVGGWWKGRDDKIGKNIRFSLLVDIETEDENVDIYTKIKNIIELPIVPTITT
jgi:hypothetical protein